MKKINNRVISWLDSPNWLTEGLVTAFILLIVALVFTWPLILHISVAIPAGSEAPAVAMFQLFSAEWTGWALEEGSSYWDAPFFYPHQGAFAWCEPQPLSCILIWLLAKITGYILAYNIVVIGYLVGFGLIGYAMARLLTEDRVVSIWCGVWLTAGAYSLQQLCALPLLAVAFPAGCIFFSFLRLNKQKQIFFWLAVLMYIFTWLTCKQNGLFLTLLLPVLLSPFLSLRKYQTLTMVNSFLALILFMVVLLPYGISQLSHTQAMGFERMLKYVRVVFRLKNLFIPAEGHWLTSRILGLKAYSWDIGIIPFLVIILAISSGIFKSGFSSDAFEKKILRGLFLMAVVALFLGFGPKLGAVIQGKIYGPYALLFSIIPGLNLIRAPARLIFFVIFGIAILSAFAFAYLRRRIKVKRLRFILSLVFFLLLFAEMWTVPIPLVFPEREVSEHLKVINWLRKYAAGKPVLELPIPEGRKTVDLQPQAAAMLRMLRHQSPIVNGYASFTPLPFKQLRKAMVTDPEGRGRRYIDAYGVRYVFLHEHTLPADEEKKIYRALGRNIVYRDVAHAIYLLPEKKKIKDIREFLPLSAVLNKGVPQRGRIYTLPLPQPVTQALLIMPQPNWYVNYTWTDLKGLQRTKRIRIRGSVLVDRGEPRLYLRILRFPQREKEAEGVLVSAEEITTVKH